MRAPATTALLVLALSLAACSGGHRDPGGAGGRGHGASARLGLKGSDTMVVLAQRWAEEYMRSHPGCAVEVSGGGSGTGVAALLNGTTDIANTSRPLRDSERARLAARDGEPTEVPVALDAIAIYVHRDNPIPSLTVEQLALIYRGRITRWSDLGGPDRPIVLYSRENNSGTYAYFKERVLGDLDFAAAAQTLPGTAAVINAVANDRNSIGYGGIGYGSGVRTVPVVGADGTPVEPTMENATSGRYPLARHLYMVTRGEPTGIAREFLDWVRSPEGQALVDNVGFYPLPRE